MAKKKSTALSKTKVNRKGKTVNAERSRVAKNNRNKGQAFELECIKELKPVFPDAIRHLEFQKEEAAKGIDISYTDHYDFQCKRGHKYATISKIEEIQRVMGRVPVLLTRGDKKKTIACLYLEDFISLLHDEKAVADLGCEITQLKLKLEKPPRLDEAQAQIDHMNDLVGEHDKKVEDKIIMDYLIDDLI